MADIKINYTASQLHAGDALVILPTHLFHLESKSDDFECELVLYTDEYWTSISQSINYPMLKTVEHYPLVCIPKGKRDEIYNLLVQIKEHEDSAYSSMSYNAIEQSIAASYAYVLMMNVCLIIDRANTELPKTVSRKESLTRDFFDLLAVHYATQRQVTFYASNLCVTPKHLSMMIKDVTKSPIQDWINNVTILHIKRLLRTTNASVQQISEDLNFNSPSTFIRFFRQHTGTTPLKYRQSCE
jgi:AraC-like DNA-binding protein